MSNIRMTRADVDEGTWRAFRAMCIEEGTDVAGRLGELIKEAVLTHNRAKRTPQRGSRRLP
jgi:hypothetical protein